MSIRLASFRWCMLIGAGALLGVALYYGFGYVGLRIALDNSTLEPFYGQTMRALWLGYCLQAALLGLLYVVAAARPHWLSPPVLVISGLLPLAEGIFALSFTGSFWLMMLLFCASLFVLAGAMLWPRRSAAAAAPEPPDVTSAPGPIP